MDSMDPDSNDSSPPPLSVRWLRPTISTPHLQLSTVPISVSKIDRWISLSAEESAQCEEAWQALSEEQQIAAEATTHGTQGQVLPEEDDDDDETVGVTISEDRLFEVDVRKMELRPIYWKISSPPIKVQRATWMYDETRPAPKHLCDQLDAAYKLIGPWQSSYRLELEIAAGIGPEAHEKLRFPISPAQETDTGTGSENTQLFGIFEDAFTVKITSNNLNHVFSTPFFGSIGRPSKARSITYSGMAVYYGYDAALAAHASNPSGAKLKQGDEAAAAMTNTTGIGIEKPAQSVEGPKSPTQQDNERTHVGDEGPKAVTDLVLIVHGIGQGYAPQNEAWDFVYAANLFRQIARKQATLPALASILRNKQVQFLPVQWRASLRLGEEEERERERDGLDNRFSIADITLKKTIPAIRDLTNNVLIEIPYFMSPRHQGPMIESVCAQANRTYRLWCARNPGFDKHGRVHIIGHSLGSVLSAYILSKQPTIQPPLSQMDPDAARQCRDRFLFNTSALFLVGSPMPVFVHLNHAQVIARKGRERTKESLHDEALDREGVFGCFAVDSLYNIFNPSDPIAYLLNPCVDAERARNLPPSAVPTFNASFMSSISQRVSRLFNDVIPRPFTSSPPGSRASSPQGRPGAEHAVSMFELAGHHEALQGNRAERRFAALNPHGTLDFQLTSEGSISEYVDMITAHSSYWQDPNLAAFVLVELFASQQDLLRTGLVPGTIATSYSQHMDGI